jgi:hypothetical protein
MKGDWKWKKIVTSFQKKARLQQQKKDKKLICQPNDPF